MKKYAILAVLLLAPVLSACAVHANPGHAKIIWTGHVGIHNHGHHRHKHRKFWIKGHYNHNRRWIPGHWKVIKIH